MARPAGNMQSPEHGISSTAAGPTTEFRIADTSGVTAFPFTTDRADDARTIEHAYRLKVADPQFPSVDTRTIRRFISFLMVSACASVPDFGQAYFCF